MSPIVTIDALKRSRESVREAARILVMPTPAAVESTVPPLQDAISAVGTLAEALRSGTGMDRAEALAVLDDIHRELARVRSLLDYAAAFHAAWARILCSMASNYTAGGTAPLPDPPPRISVRG